MKQYFVYVMASFSRRTYIGVTSELERRVWQHKNGTYESHTKKYKKNRLVYFEEYQWVNDAIAREKQIKGWDQRKKLDLVKSMNPDWQDLSDGLFGEGFPVSEG
ncbi:MAG: GIY-YIG nuclease family protein [Chloroflexota bacterium]|nr:GIY-YIG nuclease family protein [Chloroflexota bacterium]